jgi:hypothetical protein
MNDDSPNTNLTEIEQIIRFKTSISACFNVLKHVKWRQNLIKSKFIKKEYSEKY